MDTNTDETAHVAPVTNPDGTVTITLLFPLPAGMNTVTLRRPKVRDLRAMDRVKGSDMDKTLWMLGQLAGLSPQELDDVDAADLEQAADVIAGFTNRAKG